MTIRKYMDKWYDMTLSFLRIFIRVDNDFNSTSHLFYNVSCKAFQMVQIQKCKVITVLSLNICIKKCAQTWCFGMLKWTNLESFKVSPLKFDFKRKGCNFL